MELRERNTGTRDIRRNWRVAGVASWARNVMRRDRVRDVFNVSGVMTARMPLSGDHDRAC